MVRDVGGSAGAMPPFPAVLGPDELRAGLADPDLVVLDGSWYLPSASRNAYAEYLAGHVPGALFFDLEAECDPGSAYPHMMPSADRLAARMSARGIGTGHLIVVYDASGTMFSAPRVRWMLRAAGHPRVAVLDGGLSGWREAGGEVTRTVTARPPAQFVADPVPGLVRTWRDVRDALADGRIQVVDARSPDRFAGTAPEPRPGVRSGHIPGSWSIHYAGLVDPGTGHLLPRRLLERLVNEAGLDPTRPVIASCGSGVTACAVALAIELLGGEDVSVYDGSWAEWGSRSDLPVGTARP